MTKDMLLALTPYATLLRQWNSKINLVSPYTLEQLETRHLADSAQLLDYLPLSPMHIADVGTGAGLPGLVLAILAPQHTFSLIESDTRKAAFLITVVQQLGLKNVQVLNQRVENISLTIPADIVTARAFAPLERLLPETQHLLAPKGYWLLLKGEALDVELRVCETLFPMTTERFPSKVISSDGACGWVIKITLKARP
jgi:16S rRNA (guanine527-N7)-methyltransferase